MIKHMYLGYESRNRIARRGMDLRLALLSIKSNKKATPR